MELTRTDMAEGVQRSEIFNVWRSEKINARKVQTVMKHFKYATNFDDFDEASKRKFCTKIKNLCVQFMDKWRKSSRVLKHFSLHNKEWLDGHLSFKGVRCEDREHMTTHTGRPKKSFNECSYTSRKRKIQNLVQENTIDAISMAAQMKLRRDGKRDAAKVIKLISSPTASPKRASKFKKCIVVPHTAPIKMTAERALALYVDNKFTKAQYIDIQQTSKTHNADIYPTYNRLLNAKKLCYPDGITITEVSGEVSLQSLVEHTTQRLVAVQKDVLKERLEEYDPNKINIVFKWGCDGASGHSRYMQGFENSHEDDASLFVVSLVPLRMTTLSKTGNQTIILWNNPVPSSTKYCRPIRIAFHKETPDFVKQQVENIRGQIKELFPTKIYIEGVHYNFNSVFSLTMIDGKTCSTLSNAAAQNCHICGATPKIMNNLDAVRARPINQNSLHLGISSLHAWIKCLECVLHIAYRLDIKSWRIEKAQKTATDARKKEVQEKIRRNMNLLVDLPKQGYGSSNTGNVARAFFQNPELASEVTGISKELIERLGTILRTICSGFAINIAAFEHFTAETARLYVQQYPWYYMPQSIHKILIHGRLIIKEAIIPIGHLSEEAQEARNKDARNFREFHSRKFSRKENVEDMFHLLLVSSDPVITSMRRVKPKLSGSLPQSVLALLQTPETPVND